MCVVSMAWTSSICPVHELMYECVVYLVDCPRGACYGLLSGCIYAVLVQSCGRIVLGS